MRFLNYILTIFEKVVKQDSPQDREVVTTKHVIADIQAVSTRPEDSENGIAQFSLTSGLSGQKREVSITPAEVKSGLKKSQVRSAKNVAPLPRERQQIAASQLAVPVTDNSYQTEITKVRERSQKRQLRRKIREQVLVIQKQGEACDTNLIIEFIGQFRQELDLVREVVSEELGRFDNADCDPFPLSLLQRYTSHGSEAELNQKFADYKLSKQLAQYSEQMRSLLPQSLNLVISTTEDGPVLAVISREYIHRSIEQLLISVPYPFTVEGEFPFQRIGDYPLTLNLSLGYLLPCRLHLSIDNELPADCLKDLRHRRLLPLSEAGDVLTSLQEYRARMLETKEIVIQTNITEYVSRLGELLLTTYHYGYGKTSLAQELLREWQSKRDEYTLILGIHEMREVIQRHAVVKIPKEQDSEELNEESILPIARSICAKEPVLADYDIDLSYTGDATEPLLGVQLSWRGMQVGTLQLQRTTSRLHQRGETGWQSGKEGRHLAQLLDQALRKVLPPKNEVYRTALIAHTARDFQAHARSIRQELALEQVQIKPADIKVVPQTPNQWIGYVKNYRQSSTQVRIELFRLFIRLYAEQGHEHLLRCSLVEYCFARGNQYFLEVKKDARPYFQLLLFLYSHMSSQEQHNYIWTYYRTLARYFALYDLNIEIGHSDAAEIETKFYIGFLAMLSSLTQQEQSEQLGFCLLDIATASSKLTLKLITALKKRHASNSLTFMAKALQEPLVLPTDVFNCLYLLMHIDPATIARTITLLSLSTGEERRNVAITLLQLVNDVGEKSLTGFTALGSDEMKTTLAFSLLVEPFCLPAAKPEQESKLKARLIAEALTLAQGTETTTYFLEKTAELAALFDRFTSSTDLKGDFGITILDTIRSARRRLVVPGELGNLVLQFLRRTEAYVTAEQAKLVRDTRLEIALVSDRALYAAHNTSIAVKISNVGSGSADNLKLEVLAIPGKYSVDEQQKIYKVDSPTDKMPVQIELFIQPLIDINEKVDLSIRLHYDTLKQKNKLATLSEQKCSVWLYSKATFIRVPQRYHIGDTATGLFYGRQDLLESMADNLRPGAYHDSSMIFYGLKRAGKTSVVTRFTDHILKENGLIKSHLPIYIDLSAESGAKKIATDEDFLYFLAAIIIKKLQSEGYQVAISIREDTFHAHAFEDFATVLATVLQILGDRHLLIAFDEFSTLYTKMSGEKDGLTPELFSFLSNTTQHNYQLTFIFAGTYVLLEMMRGHLTDLAKICIPHLISFFDEQAAHDLIETPVKRQENSAEGWLEYDPHAVEHIVTYTHSHPYLIQYICFMLVNRMNKAKHNFVTINDVISVLNEIVTKTNHERSMLIFWDEFDPWQQKMLAAIASLASDIQVPVAVSTLVQKLKEIEEPALTYYDIRRICSSLADAEMLEIARGDTDDAYSITIPLYQIWLKQNKPIRVVFSKALLSD